MKSITIFTPDGCQLSASVFYPEQSNRKLVVINSAMAVPQAYYDNFARYLSAQGFTCISYDYRGIGDSLKQNIRPRKMKIADWGRQDLDSVLQWAEKNIVTDKIFILGHSIGGQVIGLAPSSQKADGIVLVAAQHGDWRNWHGKGKLGMFVLWYAAIPILGVKEMFPSRLVGMGQVDVPSGLIRNWGRWGRKRDYLFDKSHQLDISAYKNISTPLLAYSFSDDGFAPAKALKALLRHYSAASIEHQHVKPTDIGAKSIGHFGFFKTKFEGSLWADTAAWLDKQ